MRFNKKLLKKLCELNGVSQSENNISKFICTELDKRKIKYAVDKIGNIYHINKKSKYCLITHIDEVGFEVKNISADGKIYFKKFGFIYDFYLPGKEVVFETSNEKIKGAIQFERKGASIKNLRYDASDSLYVDTGLTKEELVKHGIKRNCKFTFDSSSGFNRNVFYSKALDNRVNCYVLLKLLDSFDFSFIFSVQEEIGLLGISSKISLLKKLNKKVIVLEIQQTNNTYLDFLGNPIFINKTHGQVVEPLFNMSNLQFYEMKEGLTELDILIRNGIKANLLCIPVRYPHLSRGLVHINTISLMTNFLRKVISKN